MTAVTLAALTFVCTFGSAMLATVIRPMLPAPHLSKESQDVVRLGMGLVATMTALLLGLVTAAAKGSFDSQDVAVKNAAAGIVTLDRLLARYGPETKPTRDLLRATVQARVDATWSRDGGAASLDSTPGPPPAEKIEDQILQLSPATDTQRWFKSESLKLTEEVLKARWRMLGSSGGSVSRTFVMVVIFWLTMTFASFGLYAPRNATVVAVLFIAAFSVAAAVFLILELDDPFAGVVTISSGPMRHALSNLGQ
jgi:hypothetical protein